MSLQHVAGTRHHGALAAETVSIVVRQGSLDDANTLFKLVTDNLEEGPCWRADSRRFAVTSPASSWRRQTAKSSRAPSWRLSAPLWPKCARS